MFFVFCFLAFRFHCFIPVFFLSLSLSAVSGVFLSVHFSIFIREKAMHLSPVASDSVLMDDDDDDVYGLQSSICFSLICDRWVYVFVCACVCLPVRFDEACTFVQTKKKQTNLEKKTPRNWWICSLWALACRWKRHWQLFHRCYQSFIEKCL